MAIARIIFRNLGVTLLLAIASVFVNHALGYNTLRHDIGEHSRNAVIAIFWCAIFLTIVQARAVSGSEHNFMAAFRNGSIFSALFAAAFAVFMAFYQHVVNPQFHATYRKFFEAKLAAAKIATDIATIKLRQFDMTYDGQFPTYILFFLTTAMGGMIMAAIAAALFRKPQK
ncbi:MAG: DUF4199 family protein [Spirochaetes bacterium]|nr:DUF4199 family protein [Spirochaetota bacterium]